MVYHGERFDSALKYRTFWPRFWCGPIDACVLWPVTGIIVLATNFPLSAFAVAALIVFEQLVWWAYTVWMHARCGQTVGKMATGVRVVDAATEGPITFAQALLRESIPIVASLVLLIWEIRGAFVDRNAAIQLLRGSGGPAHEPHGLYGLAMEIPGLWFLAEVITMFSNDKRRALHDFIAGTVVIRTRLEPQVGAAVPVTTS